ncbi:MAG: DMT family transporter [Rhodobacteraceae bacterium]|nr:DMT family transporter [Paracoccaceae bacterium]
MAIGGNARGAVLMMAAMAAFTLNDTLIKLLSGDLPLMQVLTLRGLGTLVAFLALALWRGALRARPDRRDWGLIGLRTLAEVGAAWLFLSALFNMPLANATAILQALPLVVTLAGALVFREPLGWRRLSAIAVGFGGVLLIVRPGAEGFNAWSLMALASVGCVTVRDLATRRMSASVPSVLVALATSAGVTLASALASVAVDWAPIDARLGWTLVGTTVFVFAGYLLSVATMRVGDLSFVAPFRYTGLLWSLVLGLVAFGDFPRPLTLLGAAIVVATGVFTFYRERRLARALAAAVPPRV